jgi:hypothetical protein
MKLMRERQGRSRIVVVNKVGRRTLTALALIGVLPLT